MQSTFKKHLHKDLSSRLLLHILVDPEWSCGRDIITVARAAIDGGATIIQLRDKKASTRILVEQGLALRSLTCEHNVLFIVNDRVDVALAVDADGVHLGQDDDMPLQIARRLMGPERILGISAGNQKEAMAAVAADPDYLSVGPIFSTYAKPDAGAAIGTCLIAELVRRYSTPIIGIGEITAQNVGGFLQAGAIGAAVITTVVSADDIAAATRQLVSEMSRAGVLFKSQNGNSQDKKI